MQAYSTKIFDTIDYLQNGNERQKSAFKVLQAEQILKKLQTYSPLLVGTVPIDIDIPGSDLDIICDRSLAPGYKELLITHFSNYPSFQVYDALIHGESVTMAKFRLAGWDIEIYGQDLPAHQQNGYRHMCIEHQLLLTYGEPFRQKIIKLKLEGFKTEPAFALAMNLTGDPYLELLKLDLLNPSGFLPSADREQDIVGEKPKPEEM
jgi:hypothetical protein